MGENHPAIGPGAPRSRVQVRLPGGRLFEAPPGTPLGDVLRVACGDAPTPVVAAVVGGRLRELRAPLVHDAEVRPLTLADPDGVRIYRRSLSFLMLTAAGELFPEAEIFIEHSAANSAAYFCEVRGREPFTPSDLARLEARMREIVAEDAPIERTELPAADAAALFGARGEDDKARLVAERGRAVFTLYTLRRRTDCFHGYMAPSAGCLRWFALHAFKPGFMLQFPIDGGPGPLPAIEPYPKLFQVFEESGRWLERLGIRSAGALDDAIAAGRLPEVSLVAEALHEARIASVAAEIARRRGRIKIVLVAGPSASGKTTFAKRLAVQLLASGLRPFPLSLDDYFLERNRAPRDARGEPDYESLRALDLELFHDHLTGLIEGRAVQVPVYSFASASREWGATVALGADNVLIVEGIHGLNPALVAGLPSESIYRVYVSALTQLNLDRHNRINTTDCRLIRRIVRDAATRGYSATDTLRRWDSVVAAERQNIFAFQEHSDAIFNSALVHELSVLRPAADPLLLQVRPDAPEHLEANRLLALLQWFRPAPADAVPSNSILREFVGGSVLDAFRLWVPGSSASPST